MTYETVIGLEIHVQLLTASKAFCGCSTRFGAESNTQTCPVCLGLPGSLPVFNEQALEYGLKTALALNCTIGDHIKFDRKNYYYPDLPKNFQTSQYDQPLAENGFVRVAIETTVKDIGITRAHLEEDAGKLMHVEGKSYSLVDYNRTGTPLLEIVTEPDIHTPEEAYAFLTELKNILQYLEISDCTMEEGSLRCDANISLRPMGEVKLYDKVELKNMNSFKAVRAALIYEVDRQTAVYRQAGTVQSETRLWDESKQVTRSMRTKEAMHDYRYFPEPDLPPFIITKEKQEEVRSSLPELPLTKRERFIKTYGLSGYDVGVITQDKRMAQYFERAVERYDNPKQVANWLMGDVARYLNEEGKGFSCVTMSVAHFTDLLTMIDEGVISLRSAKQVLYNSIETDADPRAIVKEKNLIQISDGAALEPVIAEVIAAHESSVVDYCKGKDNALMFLVGCVMKATRGKANPKMVNELLRQKLEDRRGLQE